MKKLVLFYFFYQMFNVCSGQNKKNRFSLNKRIDKVEVVGQLGKKLGTIITVQGIIVEGPDKGYEDGLNLVVQKINDSSTQHFIRIPVSPYFGKFGEKPLPELKVGATYNLRVYETGEFMVYLRRLIRRQVLLYKLSAFTFEITWLLFLEKKSIQ